MSDTTYGAVSASTREIVRKAVFDEGPLTRGQIADRTKLSRPSVSGAVADLIRSGVAEEVDVPASGRGRPSRRIRVSRRRADVIGIELGRGHVAVAVADASQAVVASAAKDIDAAMTLGDRALLALDIADGLASSEGIDLSGVRRVAVGTPGPRFRETARPGVDFSLARLERERSAVAETVQRHYGVPVDVENNTRYTALAEARRREESRVTDLIYLRVDEGIGGGLVIDGALASGSWGAAGEMGHVSLDPNGERCPCGGRGCLELVASLPAIVRASGAVSAAHLMQHAGGSRATAAIAEAAVATGTVLAGVLAAINPSVVVVGGSVSLLPGFLDTLESTARDSAPTWATLDLVVERAVIDHLLGAMGAAAAAATAQEPPTSIDRRRS